MSGTNDDPRLEELLEVMVQLATGQFKARAPVSDALDAVDALAVGINSLAGELDGAVASREELEDTNDELKRTQAQLVQSGKLAAIGQLAAGVAHEINNPAAAAVAALASLTREVDALRTAMGNVGVAFESHFHKLESTAAYARSAFDRIHTVVGDLRAFARFDEQLDETFDLNEVVDTACRLAIPGLRGMASVQVELGPKLGVRGNPGRLGQVVTNLVINAGQAAAAGDGEPRVVVSIRRREEAALVVVEDSGIGVAEDIREQIFEPFFTTKPADVGTGLGLALVRELVAAHSGSITIGDSTALGGARFEVSLPISPNRMSTSDRYKVVRPSESSRVLLIDDDELVLRAFEGLLEEHCEVVACAGGADALDVLRADRSFDLVLCDLHMPGVDGVDIHTYVTDNAPELTPRVVFITGGAITQRARRFVTEHRPRLLSKPFDPDALLALL